MSRSHLIGGVLLALIVAATGHAQSYTLTEPGQAGNCLHYKIDLMLAGEMRIMQNGKTVPIKLEASASHEFSERILVPGSAGLVRKAARYYEKAQASISAAGE